VEKAVFGENAREDDPAYITSMTKAYFKDGNVSYALQFFERSIHKRREQREKQDEHLL